VAVNTGLGNLDVQSLALGSDGRTVWAGTAASGVFKSSDGGASWAAFNTGMGNQTVLSLALGSDGQTVFAGTYSGVFKSSDGGANWAVTNTGLGYQNVFSLVLGGDDQTVFAGTGYGGVFKSSDGGASWAAANTGLGNLDVRSLVLGSDGQTVWAGTWGGVFKSSNGGANWAAASTGLGGLNVSSLALGSDGQTLWAGTNGGSAFKSTNGALSSESRLLNLELSVGGSPVALSPSFDSGTLDYTATVQGAGSATLTPTEWINDQTITANGTPVASGSASAPIVLNPGSNALSVVVTSGDATSTRTYTVTVTRQVVAPAAPTDVQAVLGAPGTGQATVSWTPSATSGTSALAGYTVAGGGSGCAAGPGDSSCVVTGLANGTAYSFTVTAANAEGATAVSAHSNTVTPLGANAITFPPQVGQTYTTGGSFAISPAATGLSSAPVTYSSLSTGVCTVAGSTVTMVSTGTCTLAANQAADANWGAAAQATQTVTIGLGTNAITFPAQVGQAFVAGGSFAISPVATGKSSAPVTYSSLSTGVCTVAGTTVTMVSAGTCTLAANQAADANWGAAPQATQTVQITATAPGAPTGVTATPSGPTQVTVRWTAPANDGGGITQYTVRALLNGQPSGQTCTATPPTTQCTVTGLEPGKTYTFTVDATNGAGSTAAPAPSNPATPLADAKVYTAPSPTNTGLVSVAVTSGGGAACAFERVQLLPAASASPTPPANVQFPHGVLDFVLNGCDATLVTLTITYPQALPQGVQYWKLRNGTWAAYGQAVAVAGSTTAMLTLQDGGMGDDDGVPTPDGRIVDPGQVAVLAAPGQGSATAIPTLGTWALGLLAAVLGLLGVRQRRPARA
jgi:hypothetical protein